PDGDMIENIVAACERDKPTDVFVFSHGWMGDVPGAKDQYDRWIGVMCSRLTDIEKVKARRPGFKPLLIGLHWPSKPWGDESLANRPPSFEAPSTLVDYSEIDIGREAAFYAEILGDSQETTESLKRVFAAAKKREAFSPEIADAYAKLQGAAKQ